MKLLFLGPENSVYRFLYDNHHVTRIEEKLNADLMDKDYDLVISYGYRHIIKSPIIDMYRGKIINLHISYLPYNRGADPNLWSILSDTPKGVTIHHLDEGLDTGRIIRQREIYITKEDTLFSSYNKLGVQMLLLFETFFTEFVRTNNIPYGTVQDEGNATLNRTKDKNIFFKHFPDGWHTSVYDAKRTYDKIIGGC